MKLKSISQSIAAVLLLTGASSAMANLDGYPYLLNVEASQYKLSTYQLYQNQLKFGYYEFSPNSNAVTYRYYRFLPDSNPQGWLFGNITHESPVAEHFGQSCASSARGQFKMPAYNGEVYEYGTYNVSGNTLTVTINNENRVWTKTSVNGKNRWVLSQTTQSDVTRFEGYGLASDSLNGPVSNITESQMKTEYYGTMQYLNIGATADRYKQNTWIQGSKTHSIFPATSEIGLRPDPSNPSKLISTRYTEFKDEAVNIKVTNDLVSYTSLCGDDTGKPYCHNAWGYNLSSNNSLIYYHGGHIYDTANDNGNACWDTAESVGGHSQLLWGAWEPGQSQFSGFVMVEMSYEGDGYPFWAIGVYQ